MHKTGMIIDGYLRELVDSGLNELNVKGLNKKWLFCHELSRL